MLHSKLQAPEQKQWPETSWRTAGHEGKGTAETSESFVVRKELTSTSEDAKHLESLAAS